MAKVRLIQGKGDWTDVPPTGASDADLSHLANDFIEDGGVIKPENGNALVEESDTPGMHVKVAPGVIYVENSSWTENSVEPRTYQVVRDTEETGVTIASNSSGSTRIDLICQEIDKVTTPNDDADNVCPITVVQGTPGAGIPATPNDHERLAYVTVADGETSITNAEITDTRRTVALSNVPKTLDKDMSQVSVNNTVTETTIYSKTIDAGILETTRWLRATILGTYLNNSGSARDLTIKLKYGATTIATAVASLSASGADLAGIVMEAFLAANDSATSQKGGFNLVGRHTPTNQNNVILSGYGSASENSALDKTLSITVQHGAAHASLTFAKEAAILEFIN